MDNMNQVMLGEMGKMNYEVDQIGDMFTPFRMMPFNSGRFTFFSHHAESSGLHNRANRSSYIYF